VLLVLLLLTPSSRAQDIALHALYQTAVCNADNLANKFPVSCSPDAPNSAKLGDSRFGERFVSLRLASLAALILMRIKVYTFFKFKAEEPQFSYCLEVRRAVPESPCGQAAADQQPESNAYAAQSDAPMAPTWDQELPQ